MSEESPGLASAPAPAPASAAGAPGAAPYAGMVSLLALAACDSGSSSDPGGGVVSIPSDGGTSSTPTPSPTSPAPQPTEIEAARFLAQASMGSTRVDIAEVRSLGYAGWLDAQFAKPRSAAIWDLMMATGYGAASNRENGEGFDNMMWRSLINHGDQLRQRVTMALLEILVVGVGGVNVRWRHFAMAAYVDVLFDNAFGNYRTLIEKISTNVAMGTYLTFLDNRKADSATGSVPDENYAREILQLFSIGLKELNADGTDKAPAQDTYTQSDITNLARVFTGLTYDSTDDISPDRLRRPMVFNAGWHETGASTFLGVTVPAGTSGPDALKIALDTIFAHPNVPPFISKQLIQRLVTSNPSPAYVGRISAVFANNGSGVRGDLRAVVRAILLDNEARTLPTSPNAGKLRDPSMRITNWARAFGVTSASGLYPLSDLSSQSYRIGHSPGRSPSVFNWYRPGYVPPATAMSQQGLVAPEFQITNDVTVISYMNYMFQLVPKGTGDLKPDYSPLVSKAADSAALVDEVNLVLAAGQLSPAAVQTIKGAVDALPATSTDNRIHTAVLLTLVSPDYLTLR